MSRPEYAFCHTGDSATHSNLVRAYQTIPDVAEGAGRTMTKKRLIETILNARRAYWNERANAPSVRNIPYPPARGPDTITAPEVNEWLQTVPAWEPL